MPADTESTPSFTSEANPLMVKTHSGLPSRERIWQ